VSSDQADSEIRKIEIRRSRAGGKSQLEVCEIDAWADAESPHDAKPKRAPEGLAGANLSLALGR
jgi:hypothetical protein